MDTLYTIFFKSAANEFYYCIFSVACLEEDKKIPKMAKLVKITKKINLSKDGNGQTHPPKDGN